MGMFDFTTEIHTITTTSNCQAVGNTNDSTFKARVEIQTDAPDYLRYDAIMREVSRRLEPYAGAIGEADAIEINIYT